jgi:hypothetical protein
MDKLSLDDPGAIQAIGILADVLDGVAAPGALDTVMVSKALRQVMITRSAPAFEFASRAFRTLDPEVRRQVAADADQAANDVADLRGRVGGFLSVAPRRPETQRERGQGSSFLTALNRRRRLEE